MFFKVLRTFRSILAIYVFFIMSYGFGFFILHEDLMVPLTGMQHNDTRQMNTATIWNLFGKGLAKTTVMFTGEFDFTEWYLTFESRRVINDTSKTEYSLENNHPDLAKASMVLSYLFFLSFVVLIVIVLANLLNGLAVADINAIQKEAEMYSQISRLDIIYEFENARIGSFNNLKRLIKTCCPAVWQKHQMFFCNLVGLSDMLIFKNPSPNPHTINELLAYDEKTAGRLDVLSTSSMDQSIIQSAKKIIAKRANEIVDNSDLKKIILDNQAKMLQRIEMLEELIAKK